jgi:peptidoglycan/LPS O-acetylase OafA/YrhL
MDIPHKNNFDLLRLYLAFSVCFAHLAEASGVAAFAPLTRFFYSGIAVDCFFVLSGFLIFRSFDRSSTLRSYMNKRVRRIYPAYFSTVLLAAFLLPVLFTPTTTDLLFSREWFRYLFSNLAFLNFLQPDLPGIFTANPLQVINAPLWTIKTEVMFYLSVPFIFLLCKNIKRWLALCFLYGASLAYSFYFLHLHTTEGLDIYLRYEKQLPGQLTFFLGGGGLYVYFSLFKKYWKSCLIFAVLVILFQDMLLMQTLYPFALAITVISFALCFPYLGNWGKFGDMSYGVYIYHFPIIQIFTTLSLFDGHVWLSFTGLLLSILSTAFFSYHCIERPFLKRSSHYRQAAERTELS